MEPGTADYTTLPLLPDDVTPVGLVQCILDQESDASGRWQVVVESRAASGWEDVVSALRLEDVRTVSLGGVGCDAMLRLLPWTALVLEDGSWMRVGVPVDECGIPLPEVTTALEVVSWEEVSRVRGAQIGTPEQLELEALAESLGCSTAVKDMVAVVAQDPASDPRVALPTGAGPLVACRFAVSGPGAAGSFVGGAKLSAADSEAVLTGLSAAVPDPGGCARTHTGFVMIVGDQGGTVMIELDGCGRALGDSGGLARVAQEVVDLLDSRTS